MSQDIRDFVPAGCELLGLGEPTHQEPAFLHARNEIFAQLVELGFRSVALEIGRVSALTVDDFVQGGDGDLDAVVRAGFSHDWGGLDGNPQLVAWMRAWNHDHPADRLTFHGFDAATENMSAPSPRLSLEHARDYLGLDLDLASLLGDDHRWERTEAVLDPAQSPGATAEADRLRVIADDMLTALYARAPELIATTSLAAWLRAETHLTSGLGLLRYHKQCAQPLERNARISLLMATRDALMARNLLDIRRIEAGRGPTLVFAHNLHLQRAPSRWQLSDLDLGWTAAGAIVAPLLGERYAVIAGSLGRSEVKGLGEPDPDTYEGALTKGLTPASAVQAARTRTDVKPEQGYFPLNQATLDGVDAVLHLSE